VLPHQVFEKTEVKWTRFGGERTWVSVKIFPQHSILLVLFLKHYNTVIAERFLLSPPVQSYEHDPLSLEEARCSHYDLST
jgi:hypothetical protein